MNEENVNEFLLTTMTALLGSFCKDLRAIQVDVRDDMLISWFYFDGEITEEKKDYAWTVACDSTVAFLDRCELEENHIERLDYPLKIPNNGRFAYLRYEEPATQQITYNFLGKPLSKLLNTFNKALDSSFSEVYWPAPIDLVLQEAFLGCIKPNLRAVKGVLDELEKILYIWVYFDGEISDNDRYIMNDAIDKVKVYFNNYFTVESYIDRLDKQQRIPSIGNSIFSSNQWKNNEQNTTFTFYPNDNFYFERNMQDALLGKIGPSLRSVKIEIDEMRKVLYFWFYYDGEISQRDRFNSESAIKYMKRLFGREFSSKDKIVRLDYPNKIPSIGSVVYERDE